MRLARRLCACLPGWRRLDQLVASSPPEPLVIAAYFVTAIGFFQWAEGWSAVDCVYFAAAILSTVGYGDLAPATAAGKLASCALALAAVALIADLAQSMITRFAKTVDDVLAGASGPGRRRAADEWCGGPTETARRRARLRALLLVCAVWLVACAVVGRVAIGLRSWQDCVYFAVITATTVGFGDVAPKDPRARAVTTLVMLLGTPLFGSALGGCVAAIRGVSEEADGFVGHPVAPSGGKHLSFAAFRRELRGGVPPAIGAPVTREELLAFVLVRSSSVNTGDVRAIWDEFSRMDVNASDVDAQVSSAAVIARADARRLTTLDEWPLKSV